VRERHPFELPHYQDLTANQPSVGRPADECQSDVHILDTRTEHGHDPDLKNQEREGDDGIDQPHDEGVGPATEESGEQSEHVTEQPGKHNREESELQIDSCRVDGPREDIPTKIVGAEQVARTWRQQCRSVVRFDRIVGRDPRRQQRNGDDPAYDQSAHEECHVAG
jgi:hypothetical protein